MKKKPDRRYHQVRYYGLEKERIKRIADLEHFNRSVSAWIRTVTLNYIEDKERELGLPKLEKK